jgi:hypothetical protein
VCPAAVQASANTLTMTTQPPGTPAPAPAWVNFLITTDMPTNFVAFDMAFAANTGAAGLVTLYVDGAERGVVDESNALPDSQPYSMQTVGDLAPGQHVIAFRLDPQNTVATTITVQNLATGFGEFVPVPCAADFNQDGGIDGADVGDFFAAWEGGAVEADVNQDGGVDGADVGYFFERWEAGGC